MRACERQRQSSIIAACAEPSRSGSHESGGRSGADSRSHEADLKEREYPDKDGNIHHHTNTAAAMHGGESGSRGEKEGRRTDERDSHGGREHESHRKAS
jgi:hypothetical protein